jgi:hypothetical protein
MDGPGMPAVELGGIIILALAILGGSYGLRRGARRRRPPLSRGTAFPDDALPGAQQLPAPGRWVGYIGTGEWWSRKYWVCPDEHQSAEEALGCARERLRNGTWDGRTWTW